MSVIYGSVDAGSENSKIYCNENWSKRCQSGRTNQVGFLVVEHTDFAPVCKPRQGVQSLNEDANVGGRNWL